MQILLFALLFAVSATVVSAKNDKKIKRKGKILSENNVFGTNTCFLRCAHACVEGGCEVFDGSDTTLGSFDCTCGDCAYGEEGEGSITCDTSGIADLNTEDLSASCGGGGFDVAFLLGRDDCEPNGTGVTCPSTCECNSCECDPCAQGEECTEKKNGYQCK